MELLCPAGSLPALKTAIDNGADAVYIGFKDDTNARHFAGLNFDDKKLQRAVEYVHQHQRKLHIAINTFAHPGSAARWQAAVDRGVELGADALIIASAGSVRHAQSLADGVSLMCREKNYEFLRTEGYAAGQWILVDMNDVIVNIFQEPVRELYALEALWGHGSAAAKTAGREDRGE